MTRTRVQVAAAIAVAFVLGLLGLHVPRAHAQVGSVAPGKLTAAHAAFDADCNKCHVPFGGIPDTSCLSCHQDLADQIARKVGFHATVTSSTCASCHVDHRGRGASIIPALPKRFDHRVTTFPLAGAHATLACEKCHAGSGSQRHWAGMPTRCESCHPDAVHKGAYGSACEKCHRTDGWTPTIRTLQNHTTPITGGHAALACIDCHKSGQHLTPKQSCSQCHREQHGGTKVECSVCHNVVAWNQADFVHDFCPCKLPGKHQTAPCLACHPAFKFKPTPFECAACHDKERPHEPLGACSRCHSALSWKTPSFDHDKRTKFPLAGKHLLLGCENCHTTSHTTKRSFRVPKHECVDCHKVPEHGDFGACSRCHTTAGFEPSSFDHGTTAMPLTGAHAAVKCQDCHRTLQPGTFRAGDCSLCHADPHAGQFQPPGGAPGPAPAPAPARARGAPAGGAAPGLMQMVGDGVRASTSPPAHRISPGHACTDCHTTDRWSPSTITAQTHGDLGYALNGAHAATACTGCHRGGQFAGVTHACNGCHTDFRHRGRFGTQCADCHSEVAWKPAAGFDHTRTGFALERGHAGVGCAKCHGTDGTRLVAAKAPTACQTCHDAPHGSQFGPACTTCHSTASFRQVPAFDHDAKTNFPLERRHATLPCLTCHDASQRPKVNRACRSCHGDPHRGSNAFDCSDCHRADRWRVIRFDHDLTSYPLAGRHRVAPCGECHTNPGWTGVRTDCVACHAFDRPRTQDHLTKLACDECHSTSTWHAAAR